MPNNVLHTDIQKNCFKTSLISTSLCLSFDICHPSSPVRNSALNLAEDPSVANWAKTMWDTNQPEDMQLDMDILCLWAKMMWDTSQPQLKDTQPIMQHHDTVSGVVDMLCNLPKYVTFVFSPTSPHDDHYPYSPPPSG